MENLGNIACFAFAYNCGFLTAGVTATAAFIKFRKDSRVFKYALAGYFVGNIFAW